MYAIVSSGGKQYRVEAGSTLVVERLGHEPGAAVVFDRVLLVGDGDSVTVGTPLVAGATVSGTVVGQAAGPKLVIFKFKQKVKYRRRTGHRQRLMRVRIDAINADGQKPKATRKPRAAKTTKATKTTKAEAGEE
jgi:large subunit ribosomal protein L21